MHAYVKSLINLSFECYISFEKDTENKSLRKIL